MIKKIKIEITENELADIQSALSFFIREYEKVTRMETPQTKRAMKKLLDKTWKILRSTK